jgi:hypothetical protein
VSRPISRLAGVAVSALLLAAPALAAPLNFQVREGRNLNDLVRDGPVAAHLVLRDGTAPRLLVAFPAGDSGVGAWFEPTEKDVSWRLVSPARPVLLHDAKGRPLHGVSAEIEVDAPRLQLQRVVLGSVRVLRDYDALHQAPAVVDAPVRRDGATLTWARDRIDGAPGYRLSVETLDGDATASPAPAWTARGGRPIRLRIVAATGETPLTPLAVPDILTEAAGPDARARDSLAFLSYREKLLAGSWRFDTYFGRDTLMSVRLLLPVLKPEEAEAGLGAVLSRLSPTGEVAHEEAIGEFAVMENIKAGRGPVDTPIHDYKMIDGDYLLAPVLDAYGERFGTARLKAFLSRTDASGTSYGALLVRNLRHVVDMTRPFADAPSAERLLHLKPGNSVGQWRDSETGLAGGRIPYDVNAVYAPTALGAIVDLERKGVLTAFDASGVGLQDAPRVEQVWRDRAPAYFTTHVDPQAARQAVTRFAAEAGVDPAPALASLPAAGLTFDALSLDAAGRPIPVLNTDVGFALLMEDPAPDVLERVVDNVMRPFPAGLMTDVGPVVADAAFADPAIRKTFSKAAYHGAVVWAWQEAVLIAGLDRQRRRSDLSPSLKAKLTAARARLWTAVQAVGETRTSELWSWAYADGRYRVQAFGAAAGDADESNAAQLWSTVFLALGPDGGR